MGEWVGGYRCCKITAKNIVESIDCHDWVLVYFHCKVNALSLPLFHSHTEPPSQHYCEFVSLDQQRTSESVLKREREKERLRQLLNEREARHGKRQTPPATHPPCAHGFTPV